MLGNKKIMGNNIQMWMDKRGLSRKDFAKAIGEPYSSVTEWINGKSYPRIDKIQKMADFFGIEKADLVEYRELLSEKSDTSPDSVQNIVQPMYYTDPEGAAKAQELFTDPKYRVLFDAAPGSTAEDLQMAADLLLRLKQTRRD